MSYAHGVDPESNSTAGFAAAVAAAAAADVVVFVGGNRNCEGGQGVGGAHCESEGHDRPDLAMPGVQTQLLKELCVPPLSACGARPSGVALRVRTRSS